MDARWNRNCLMVWAPGPIRRQHSVGKKREDGGREEKQRGKWAFMNEVEHGAWRSRGGSEWRPPFPDAIPPLQR